uniref:Carbonic anhydrase n=1 Tax=Phallusia mammillata TaxID=59560 RepID=A0A6F9D7F1_9ASCI|nr:carbonic anhydrase 2-like [Phallusia mammillata]
MNCRHLLRVCGLSNACRARFASQTNTIKALYKKPHDWHQIYPIAAGKNQSPVDLIVQDSAICKQQAFPNLSLSYNPADIKSVANRNFSVTFMCEGSNSVISGGPLQNRHKLIQFHFHWGSKDDVGSEHTVNGKQYSAELHLVHMNEKYSEFPEALEHPDGLCVIGVFLQVGPNPNKAYDAIADAISKVKTEDTEHELTNGIDVTALLPQDKQYVNYNGSLTTPPLKECVQWINFIEPVNISKQHVRNNIYSIFYYILDKTLSTYFRLKLFAIFHAMQVMKNMNASWTIFDPSNPYITEHCIFANINNPKTDMQNTQECILVNYHFMKKCLL